MTGPTKERIYRIYPRTAAKEKADKKAKEAGQFRTSLLKSEWIPKKNSGNLSWKVTDVFISYNGTHAVQIEKYQGGQNSPAIITLKKLKSSFYQVHRSEQKEKELEAPRTDPRPT